MVYEDIIAGLDMDKLTTKERRKYMDRLVKYQEYFRKSINHYESHRRSKDASEKAYNRMTECQQIITELCKKCLPDHPELPDGTAMPATVTLSSAAPTKAVLADLGAAGERPLAIPISGVLKLLGNTAQDKSADKEMNEKLLMMLQTTISMLTKLNVSEMEIMSALEATLQSVSDIKNKYGDDLDDETLAKLVQDECAEKIMKDIKRDVDFEKCKEQIIKNIGMPSWEKMEEISQTFIIDAEILYEQLKNYSDFDFSAICLTASKALEIEVTKRYFSGYLRYLKDHHIMPMPSGVLNRKSEELTANEFMLGTITDITGYAVSKTTGKLFLLSKYQNENAVFLNYARSSLLKSDDQASCIQIIQKHVQAIHNVRQKYRNPSAHKNKMSHDAAKECLDYLIDVQRTLGEIIDDCRW